MQVFKEELAESRAKRLAAEIRSVESNTAVHHSMPACPLQPRCTARMLRVRLRREQALTVRGAQTHREQLGSLCEVGAQLWVRGVTAGLCRIPPLVLTRGGKACLSTGKAGSVHGSSASCQEMQPTVEPDQRRREGGASSKHLDVCSLQRKQTLSSWTC